MKTSTSTSVAERASFIPALAVVALLSGVGGNPAAAATAQLRPTHQAAHAVHARQLAVHQRTRQPSSCGEFMYWHAGQCVDIRGEHLPPWTASAF